jgi:hypothetical protein
MTDVSTLPPPNPTQRTVEMVRAIVVTGILYGVVVAGIGSRLAMLLLRITSSDRVIGIQSDDDFTIGRFTLAGTYNLLLLGAGFGILGAAVYRLVAPRLIGPVWFRRVTVGLASGAVVGSMLVHADGIDFVQLTPKWLAIGLFVALPAIFGTFIGPAFDSVSAPDSWTATGRRRWLIPVIAIACFPPTIILVLILAAVVALLTGIGEVGGVRKVRATAVATLIIRGVWLLIAVAGLVALINDIGELT